MKERTEIDQQNLHFTYMELVSCRVYDDAKLLLNNLVVKELGREYGDKCHFDEKTDEWICDEVKYKNSVNPKVVKLAVCDAMTSFLNSRELISEEGTIAYEKSKVRDTSIIPFKRMDNDMIKVRDWVQRWQKEPAPKTKTGKVYRFRPKTIGVIEISLKMFDYYLSIGKVSDNSMETWKYVCGISDSASNAPIVWHGDWPKLCALIAVFLCNELYFDFETGVRKHFLCEKGKEVFVKESGEVLTDETLKGTIQETKNNGTLKSEVSILVSNFDINITEKLKKKLNL